MTAHFINKRRAGWAAVYLEVNKCVPADSPPPLSQHLWKLHALINSVGILCHSAHN